MNCSFIAVRRAAISGAFMAFLVPTWAQNAIDLSPIADTSISSRDKTHNSGAHTHIAAGRDGNSGGNPRRGLIRFDLSSIPPGSTIESAELHLRVVIEPRFGSVDSNFLLHRLLTDWGEGTKTGNNGAPAAPGEATWNQAFHDQVSWSEAGAGSAADRVDAGSATQMVAGVAGYVWSGAALTADIQGWLKDPGSNLGWLLRSDQEDSNRSARAFGSREHSSPSFRPLLRVTYSAPPPPATPVLSAITISADDVALSFSCETNQLYDVEFAGDLTATSDWMVAESDLPGDASGTLTVDDLPYLATPAYAGNPHASYRVQTRRETNSALGATLVPVATGLVAPTVLTHAGDDSGRRFIAEQTGQIRILDAQGTLLPTPFLDLSSRMSNLTLLDIGGHSEPGLNPVYDERGLLGLTFHPDYASNGVFYVYYSTDGQAAGQDHRSVLSAFQVSPTNSQIADASSEQVLLTIDQPEFNHNGGALEFGPDGYLYLGLGDGGGSGDEHPPIGNGQQPTNLLGSIIRIDVDGTPPFEIPTDNPFATSTDKHPATFAYGFRNPWRFSFDRGGGQELFVADVGQNLWEEINVVRSGGNYGWRIMEASRLFDGDLAASLNLDPAGLDYPIHEYPHGPLGISIIGGYVYRGSDYPELEGRYVFGDFSTSFGTADGALYYLEETRPGTWQRFSFGLSSGARLGRYLKGFGTDQDGEIYVLTSHMLGPSGTGGEVLKVAPP